MSDKAEKADEAPKGKSKSKLMMIIAAVAVLGGGAGAYAFFFNKPAEEHAEEEKEPEEPRGLVAFDPFVVNLADPGGQRFLRVTVQLVVGSAEQAKEIEETKVMLMQARSAMLDLLTQQTADGLVTPEGKAALRDAIKQHVTEALHEVEIVDVLFSDFVVQF
jgi:flagellar FliL protein